MVPMQSAAQAPSSDACDRLRDSRVKAACKRGGLLEVKKAMKIAVDRHNQNSRLRLECKTCHTNTSDFQLNDRGQELFSRELAQYF